MSPARAAVGSGTPRPCSGPYAPSSCAPSDFLSGDPSTGEMNVPLPPARRLGRFELAGLGAGRAAVAVLIGPSPSSRRRTPGPPPGRVRLGRPADRSGPIRLWDLGALPGLDARTSGLRPQIADALALPGVVGLPSGFPGRPPTSLGTRSRTRSSHRPGDRDRAGKALSIRFMAGAHTPDRVFDAGASHYRVGGKGPPPLDNGTGRTRCSSTPTRLRHKLADWSGQTAYAYCTCRGSARTGPSSTTAEPCGRLRLHRGDVAPGHRELIRIGAEQPRESGREA